MNATIMTSVRPSVRPSVSLSIFLSTSICNAGGLRSHKNRNDRTGRCLSYTCMLKPTRTVISHDPDEHLQGMEKCGVCTSAATVSESNGSHARSTAEIPREQFARSKPRDILVTMSGVIGEDITKILRGNCSR